MLLKNENYYQFDSWHFKHLLRDYIYILYYLYYLSSKNEIKSKLISELKTKSNF